MASSKTTARALASIGQGLTAGVSGYLNFSELQLRRDQAQQQADMFAERKAALEQERQAMAQKQQFAAQHAYFKTIGDFASMSPEAQKAQAPKYLERVNQFAQQGGFNVFESPDELVNDMKVGDVSKSFRDFASAKNAIATALAGGTMTPDQFQSQYKVAAESIDKLANFYAFDEGDAKQFRNMRQELDQAAKTLGDRFTQRELKNKDLAMEGAKAGRVAKEKVSDMTSSLRKEATSGEMGKLYGNYKTASRGADLLRQFDADPSGFSDYGAMMSTLKALQGDTSVVREAELKQGINATSLENKVKNWASRLATGKTLQPEQRVEMIDALKKMTAVAADQYRGAVAPIRRQAQDYGIADEAIFDPGLFGQPAQAAPASPSAKPSGTKNLVDDFDLKF